MADSNYSTPLWTSMSMGSGVQGSEPSAPHLSAHAQQYQLQFRQMATYGHLSNSHLTQFHDISNAQYNGYPPGHSPYAHDGASHAYNPTHPRVYHHLQTQPRPPPAFRHLPSMPRTDLGGLVDNGDVHNGNEHHLLRGPQPFFPPYHQAYEVSQITGPPPFARRQQIPPLSLNPQLPYLGGRDPARTSVGGISDEPRLVHSPHQRTLHQGHHQNHNRPQDSAEQRSLFLHVHGHRADGSSSPRTSHRRSFDRYSVDLSRSSTSSDAEEAAARAPPSNRARHRPREVRPRMFGHFQRHDPNLVTPYQIQELKEKLPRRLPSELPEETSKACDICQKDYATTHVCPAEEQEVAVELTCGHVFGEFCLFEWIETCRTHKNKVTCPMCRKLLIEPPQYHPALLHAISRGAGEQAFQEFVANELRGDFSHM